MELRLKRFVFCAVLLFAIAIAAFSQVASYGVIPYPRATAIGSGYAGLADDPGAAFFNPAGLAGIQGIEGALSYQRPYGLSFFDDFAGSLVLPMNRYGTAALSVQNFSVTYAGNDLSAERVVGLSYGTTLLKDIHSSLAIGITGKWLYWKLGDSVPDASGASVSLGQASTFGLDVGVQASLWRRTKVGASVVNVNNPTLGNSTPHDLPQIFRAGICYQPYPNVSSVIGAERELGQDVEFGAGAEAWVFPELALRMGVTTNPNRFTGGIGIRFHGLVMDYAYLTHPELSGTHQVSIGMRMTSSFLDVIGGGSMNQIPISGGNR
jgi:hypothetical protein